MSRPTYMTIDLLALQHNVVRVREMAPGRSIIAMVKANAYGHGIVRVAHALSSLVEAFGVASLEEGMLLRDAGVTQPIALMEGLFYQDELAEAAKYHFTLVVHHQPHVEMLAASTLKTPLPIWLKINTGMNRLGFDCDEVPRVYETLQQLDVVQKPIGFMTHFAEADQVASNATLQQMTRFQQMTQHYRGPRSLANSAGILAWPDSHGDCVRPGLMLYGASPLAKCTGLNHSLKPVMTLWSRLIAITTVKKGEKIGYGGTWEAPETMTVGIVGVGYGDGYPQFAKNGTPTLVNGVECALVGRVSMDMLAVDLRPHPKAAIGDTVVLWGEGLPVERIAEYNHTSAYEILTRMTPRPKIEIKS